MFFETSALLEQAGHQVIPFCLRGAKDSPSAWSGYFPTGADTGNPALRDLPRYFWNREARDQLNRLLDAARSTSRICISITAR